MKYALAALLSASGCAGVPPSGTAVGNPGDADAKVSRLDPSLSLSRVELPLSALLLVGCDGTERLVEQALALDGLLPSLALAFVPGGTFCEMTLVPDGPVLVSGSTPAGNTFSVALAVQSLPYEGEVIVDGQLLLFDLPLSLDAATLDALGSEVFIPADDPLAIEWSTAMTSAVRLWEDGDEDGILSPGDRELVAMPFDTGHPSALSESNSAGCGCAQRTGAPSALLGMFMAFFVFFAQALRHPSDGAP